MSRREYPADPQTMRARNLYAWTELEALQMCAPFEEPELARRDILWVRDIIDDTASQVLDEREQWIFDAIVVERKSLRAIGRDLRLSKTQVWRIYHKSINRLRSALSEAAPTLLERWHQR